MKTFVVAAFVAAVLFEITSAQCIRAAPTSILGSCGIPACSPAILSPAPATIIQAPNSVAASLADTLSLLTVSSLLAEALPLGPSIVTVAPSCNYGQVPMGASAAGPPAYGIGAYGGIYL